MTFYLWLNLIKYLMKCILTGNWAGFIQSVCGLFTHWCPWLQSNAMARLSSISRITHFSMAIV